MGRTGPSSLHIAFMGTPDFAVPSLLALAEAGHEIACVYSQPPRPARRGLQPRPSPVSQAAEDHGWPVRTPTSLKDPAVQRDFAALELDAAIVVAYGLILPAAVLAAPRLGCLNVHASLLPRWRGAAPIQRAILAGDPETGVTIMQMDEGLDSGAILDQASAEIGATTTAAELHDRLAALGAERIGPALASLAAGEIEPQAQPEAGITYAAKLTRAEARLDWRQPADQLERQVRAFTPWPGAVAVVSGAKGEESLKVLAAEVQPGQDAASPGQVLDDRLTIACGTGALRLTRLQRPGRADMAAEELLKGYAIPAGTTLPLSPEPS